jgi:hypothetical protein
MAPAFHENKSHLDLDDPDMSVHGGKGDAEKGVNDTNVPETEEGAGDASSVDFVQDKAPPIPPVTRKQKVKRHLKRFKWWYLAAGIILLAVILIVM